MEPLHGTQNNDGKDEDEVVHNHGELVVHENRPLKDYLKAESWDDGGTRVRPITIQGCKLIILADMLILVERNPFCGEPHEDPHDHIYTFILICDLCGVDGYTDNDIRIRLFPFSLMGAAKKWYTSLDAGVINSWDDLYVAFMDRFFPLRKRMEIVKEIAMFHQRSAEGLGEAWIRFRSLFKMLPRQAFTPDYQLNIFFDGLNCLEKDLLNASSGGRFRDQGTTKCLDILNEMASESETSSLYEDEQRGNLDAKIDALTSVVNKLTKTIDSLMMRQGQGMTMEEDNYHKDQYAYFGNDGRNFQLRG